MLTKRRSLFGVAALLASGIAPHPAGAQSDICFEASGWWTETLGRLRAMDAFVTRQASYSVLFGQAFPTYDESSGQVVMLRGFASAQQASSPPDELSALNDLAAKAMGGIADIVVGASVYEHQADIGGFLSTLVSLEDAEQTMLASCPSFEAY